MPTGAYYIDELQDYLEGLCQSHEDIQHNVDSRRGFARFESDEHIRQIVNNATLVAVIVADYYGQRVGEIEEYRIRQVVQIRFVVKRIVGNSTPTDEINEAIKKAEQVMFDFIARMEKDFYDDDCGSLRGLEPDKITWDKVEDQPWLDDYYGWDLNIPLRSNLPAYDATKWIEP